jgi:heme-degrading monooxygenase HmoA
MLHHLCLITYNDPAAVDDAAQQAIDDAYTSLLTIIPGILSMRVGRDLALLDGNAHFGIVATFESREAFQAYSIHPAHMDIIYPALGRYMAGYSTAQFDA